MFFVPKTMSLTRFLFFVLLLSVPSIFSSCDILDSGPCLEGKGARTTEHRATTSFTAIDMRLPGKIYVSPGNNFSVSIETFSNILPEIITEIAGNTLVFRSESCLEYSNPDAIIHITMPAIEGVELKSNGEVHLQSVPSQQILRLNLSGSGSIYYTGHTAKMNLLLSGSGDIELFGSASYLESTLSGSGRVLGFSLLAETVKTVLAGSGYQQVWATESLDATITGSGNIHYKGTPSLISTYTSGSGRLINSN